LADEDEVSTFKALMHNFHLRVVMKVNVFTTVLFVFQRYATAPAV